MKQLIPYLFFNGKASEIVHAAFGAQVIPDPGTEQTGSRDVAAREQQAFLDPYFVVILVQHTEVEGEQRNHNTDKQQPDPCGRAEKVGVHEFH